MLSLYSLDLDVVYRLGRQMRMMMQGHAEGGEWAIG